MKDRFGSYSVARRIAIGGMGEIYLAYQDGVAELSRPVILKLLRPELAQNPNHIQAFLDEARMAATISHPNIVAIYEVGVVDDEYFIVMEYIAGASVAKLQNAAIDQGERIPREAVLRIVCDAATGLSHAHRAVDVEGHPLQLMHRDISPQNLMVGANGVTKVVDFGIAKAANRHAPTTAQGVLKGKFGYMAPEQLFGDVVDQSVDQFALGIVFRELLLGRPYLQDVEGAAAAFRFMTKPIAPIQSEAHDVPDEIAAIVDRMVQFQRPDRFDDLGQVVEALEAELTTTDHTNVAAFVDHIAGDAVRALLAETAPTRAIVESPNTTAYVTEATRRGGLYATVGLAALASATLTAWVLTTEPSIPPVPVQAAAPAPPLPAPAPVVEAPAPEPAPNVPAAKKTPPKRRTRRVRKAPTAAAPAPAAATPGELTLNTVPNARVSIDGGPWVSTPVFKRRLPAGRHAVRAKVDDENIDVTFDVVIEAGKLKKVRKQLR